MNLLGGETTLNGEILFASENFIVTGSYKVNEIQISYCENHTSIYRSFWGKFLDRWMPFNYEKDSRVLKINIMPLLFIIFYGIDKIYFHINLPTYIYIMFYLVLLVKTKCNNQLTRLHGAEHKVAIYYIGSGGLTDLDGILNTNRTTIKCGTMHDMFELIFFCIAAILIKDSLIVAVLSYIIGYLSYYAILDNENLRKNILIMTILKISEFIQEKIMTAEPSVKDITLALALIEKLDELENTLNKKPPS